MITSLIKVALLSVGACNNAVLSTPKQQYNTEDTPDFNNTISIDPEDLEMVYMELEQEGNGAEDPYTNATFSQAIYTITTESIRSKSLFMTANQVEQSQNNSDGDYIDTPERRPFALNITSFEITTNSNIVVDFTMKKMNANVVNYELNDQEWILYKKTYTTYDEEIDRYIETLWDYYSVNQNSLTADTPFNYKNNLIGKLQNTAEMANTTWNSFYLTNGEKIEVSAPYSQRGKAQTLRNGQKLYVVQTIEIERKNKNYIYSTDEPSTPIFNFDWVEEDNTVRASTYTQKGWYITPINYEVINIPDVMFTIVSMPFTFISRSFNLTLFPNTPYAVNIGNIFLSIIAILTFIFVLKILLKMKG